MKLQHHAAASIGLLALSPFIGIGPASIAAISSVAIDLDHIHILIREQAWSWKKIRRISENIHKSSLAGKPNRAYVDIFYLFHTLEFNLVLLAGSFFAPSLLFVSIGFLYHDVFDVVHHWRHGLPLKWLSLANWIRYELSPAKPILAKLSEAY